MRLLLATHNEHKRREFERILATQSAAIRVELDALPADVALPPEAGEMFAENALEKARAAAGATGRVSIADDSGIAAEALDGRPGVRSARFAGEHATDKQNLDRLIREAPAGSRLEYICVIAHVDPQDGSERLFAGRCGGHMAEQPKGERGFGYDPVFVPLDGPGGMTMAELDDQQKDAISHRGRAARALLAWLAGDEQPDRARAG
jgi:XTP/dITP diphosphohydrolase